MNKICFYILCIILISGCRTLKDEEYIGPEVIAAPENFSVTGDQFQASSEQVDFTSAPVYFKSHFSHRVSWNLLITGLESQAVKMFKGTSEHLDSINTLWPGNSDNIYLFRKNEKVLAQLTFYGSNSILTDTFEIVKTKLYEGLLISDFEGGGIVPVWSTFWTAGKMISRGVQSELHTPQGSSYFHMKGNDYNGGTGVGGMTHTQLPYGLSGKPDNLYLNLYINGLPNTRLDIRIFENDGDAYTYEQFITWTGWKLVSLLYTAFQLTSSAQTNGQNSENISGMSMLLKSSPAGNVVEANVDYIIFTNDGPFEP
ncbi:MAG: hypothetical protein ACK40G_00145 [Cytophagaceae bacterium]